MARYIDVDKAIAHIRGECESYYPTTFLAGISATINELNKIPTADVVEVVRCKDCRYWQDNNGGYPHEECRWGKDETPDADDFCSYGERKDT